MSKKTVKTTAEVKADQPEAEKPVKTKVEKKTTPKVKRVTAKKVPGEKNRYEILNDELKAINTTRKAAKKVMLDAIADAQKVYRDYVKLSYNPLRNEAIQKFKSSVVRTYVKKPKTEVKVDALEKVEAVEKVDADQEVPIIAVA